jgi:molybdopterin synthase sulfur carrier subunit
MGGSDAERQGEGQAGVVTRPGPSVPVVLLLFAAARQAAGTGQEHVTGVVVADVVADAERRHGPDFARVVARSRVWVNGEEALPSTVLAAGDEVAVLPPVSGGA